MTERCGDTSDMFPDVDLFGNDHAPPPKRKTTLPRGHAWTPGTGPAGETCRTCLHYTIRRNASPFRKCKLTEPYWTNGPGTDIRAGDPACKKWEAKG